MKENLKARVPKEPKEAEVVAQKDNLGYYYPAESVDVKTNVKIIAGGRVQGAPDQV